MSTPPKVYCWHCGGELQPKQKDPEHNTNLVVPECVSWLCQRRRLSEFVRGVFEKVREIRRGEG